MNLTCTHRPFPFPLRHTRHKDFVRLNPTEPGIEKKGLAPSVRSSTRGKSHGNEPEQTTLSLMRHSAPNLNWGLYLPAGAPRWFARSMFSVEGLSTSAPS